MPSAHPADLTIDGERRLRGVPQMLHRDDPGCEGGDDWKKTAAAASRELARRVKEAGGHG